MESTAATQTPPPGLNENLVELLSGGNANAQWRDLQPFKLFTNVFVCDKSAGMVLLGMKKRGFGKGMYNGFGGKVEPGESPIEGAARELEEEAGISAKLKECGILLFVNASAEYCHYVHVYRADEYEGEPIETEEMHPHWFAIPKRYRSELEEALGEVSAPEIPFAQMWPDDELWMPLLLKGEYFYGRVDLGRNDSDAQKGSWVMEKWWIGKRQ
ncbi:hypothetical protein M0805_006153 [Coniferiporia weirii]|nr:hypothetical protein M0805_006153 [Coniferiporia weirii]